MQRRQDGGRNNPGKLGGQGQTYEKLKHTSPNGPAGPYDPVASSRASTPDVPLIRWENLRSKVATEAACGIKAVLQIRHT